jgi:peptide/nickel transport system substrate-binding protein
LRNRFTPRRASPTARCVSPYMILVLVWLRNCCTATPRNTDTAQQLFVHVLPGYPFTPNEPRSLTNAQNWHIDSGTNCGTIIGRVQGLSHDVLTMCCKRPFMAAPFLSEFAAESADKSGTIVFAVHEFTPIFDIHNETSYIGIQPMNPIYNGLLTLDVYNNYEIVGDLAERWEVASDSKRVTFYLHKGVTFHDGSPFSCADAKYSIDRMANPKRASRNFVTYFKQVYDSSSCTDDFTLVLSLKRPSPALLSVLSLSMAVMMKKDIDDHFDRKDPRFLIGTGPFKYKSHTPGVDFQAERNPNYWKPGLPHIGGYRAVIMSDLTKIFASFRARQLTMTGIARHLERPEAEILQKDFPDGVVAIGPRSTWDNFVMNVSKPPFNDLRVRKAVALATDREKMIEIAVEGWDAIGGYIGPHTHTPFALPLEELRQYPQFGPDMEKRRAEAKRLLAEAGYAHGLDVQLVLRRGPLYERGALSRQDERCTTSASLRRYGVKAASVCNSPTPIACVASSS